MISMDVQKRFIELRAQGWSFARIAQELNVSKQTLINWSRKYRFEIQNLHAIELEALQHQLIDSHEARLRALGEHLRRIESELAKRDLAQVPTGRLFSLADSLRRQIIRETGKLQFTSPVDDIPDGEYYEEVQDWKP